MLTPKDAILFKIGLKCAKECLILKCKYIQNPWWYTFPKSSTGGVWILNGIAHCECVFLKSNSAHFMIAEYKCQSTTNELSKTSPAVCTIPSWQLHHGVVYWMLYQTSYKTNHVEHYTHACESTTHQWVNDHKLTLKSRASKSTGAGECPFQKKNHGQQKKKKKEEEE